MVLLLSYTCGYDYQIGYYAQPVLISGAIHFLAPDEFSKPSADVPAPGKSTAISRPGGAERPYEVLEIMGSAVPESRPG